ncbi:MAG: flagellar biosynthesis protein FlhF [Desulfovibrio sp.]|jgi:flagellar biosynthesis protein FlhF|nr:flagellar biosynthesis protein FlhF [Desulfovibrio sp.]
MQVKTFTGTTSQDVLAKVKAEMGPEAVILSNRTYRKNGVVFHEITAGIEQHTSAAAGTASGMTDSWGEWHKEWMQIKEQLFALMKPAIQMERLTPRQRIALEYLQREGVSDAVAVDLYRRLLARPGVSVLECLYSMVPVKAWGTTNWDERVHLFTGPFGSGKTTTALRFALALRKSEPEARIVFINADCLRGNGRLILRHWAELSNFAYIEAPDKAAMEHALSASTNARAVFIDTPGFSQNQNLVQWREEMNLADTNIAVHLTLSHYCDPLQTQVFLRRYKCEGRASVVWTKLDEAVSFGALVNVACSSGLPISALSFGAELKESLVPATEPLIWRLIFKRQLPGQAAAGPASS